MKKSTLLVVIIIVLCALVGFMFPCCKTKVERDPYWYSGDNMMKLRKDIPDSTWNKFLECSKDMGDAGCDSCWRAIVEGGQ